MQVIADLHIHGRFSRGCSTNITVGLLEKYARIKGISLLGAGDFTHPSWFQELSGQLKEDDAGIMWSKTGFPFVWQTEISLIYSENGKGRRVHHLLLAPNRETVVQIIEALKKKGRIDYDGRPIFGISSVEFAEMVMGISKKCLIIPAHAWTPWFGILGSKSGFDSVEECFQEKSKYVYAIETGLSSDPEMNFRVSSLDKYTLVSFSDAHSFWPWRMGREATVFDMKEITYENLFSGIKEKKGFLETIEVDPAYGKYHLDGHRKCNVVFEPSESRKLKKICPKCKSGLTIGVLHRVEELADRPVGFQPRTAQKSRKLIPLSELIAAVTNKGVETKSVSEIYDKLISVFTDEFSILLTAPGEQLLKHAAKPLADAIMKNRLGKVGITPGYDGVYGVPHFEARQKGLSDF